MLFPMSTKRVYCRAENAKREELGDHAAVRMSISLALKHRAI